MKEMDNNSVLLSDVEMNMFLLITTAIEGYAKENGEPFSVDNTIINDLILRNLAEGTSVPSVRVDTRSGRCEITVEMLENAEESDGEDINEV